MELLLIGIVMFLIAYIIRRIGDLETALKVYKLELERLKNKVDK